MDVEKLPSGQARTALPTDPVTKSQPANERCKLGVLFVHGMGEQQEGETLSAFGEPLIAWIREWIARDTANLLSVNRSDQPSANG